MKLNLARQITTQQELRNLATLGLRVKSNVIDTKLTNERDINEAALKVIQQWASSKEDKGAAFVELCEILVKIRRSAYINVLKDEVVDWSSEFTGAHNAWETRLYAKFQRYEIMCDFESTYLPHSTKFHIDKKC